MRKTKRLILLLLVLSLSLGLFGCELPFLSPDGNDGDSGEPFTPTVYTVVTKDAFEATYADQLSPNEKAIYDALLAAPAGTEALEITLPELPRLCQGRAPTDEEMDQLSDDIGVFTANALYAAWLDSPTLFWLDHSKYSYDISVESDETGVVSLKKLTVNLISSMTVDAIAEKTAALEAAVKSFAPLGATDAEKVAYINTYLTSRIEYDLDAPNRSSIIGALVDGKCVCEGYARAFDYLAERAGLDVVCIPGYAYTEEEPEGEGHMWNGVFIDGTLYAVDTTWNDTTKKNSYLLVGSDTVCDGKAFGETHKPNMLAETGPYKAFALPVISKLGYGINP